LRNVYEINWENLRVWLLWLAKDYQRSGAKRVGIGAKSRLDVLTAFRGFFKWLRRHEQYRALPTPEWPSVAVVKTKRRTMGSLATQADAIERVPAEHRGIFYAMAHLTLRNGEARALRWGDYDFRRRDLFVGWAMKSGAASSERKETKTDANAWYPVSAALAAWLAWRFPPESRFDREAPLFAHPTTGHP
jgi:integrase